MNLESRASSQLQCPSFLIEQFTFTTSSVDIHRIFQGRLLVVRAMETKKSVPGRSALRTLQPATPSYTDASSPAHPSQVAHFNAQNVYIEDAGTSTSQQIGPLPFIPQPPAVRHPPYLNTQFFSQAAHAPTHVHHANMDMFGSQPLGPPPAYAAAPPAPIQRHQANIDIFGRQPLRSTSPYAAASPAPIHLHQANIDMIGSQPMGQPAAYTAPPPAPMQLHQASIGTFGLQSMGSPPPYATAMPAPMPFEKPHNTVAEYVQPSEAYVFGTSSEAVQQAAPMFAAPTVGQVANGMFNYVQMSNAPVSEPMPAPVQLSATTVHMPAVGPTASAGQEMYKHPMSKEEERRTRDYVTDVFYSPLKRLFDQEAAQRSPQAEADSQRLPHSLDQKAPERTQQPTNAHAVSARPIQDPVPEETSGQWAVSLPGRSAAPNVVGWGDEIPPALDAGYGMSSAAFDGYVPMTRVAGPKTQTAVQYLRRPPNEPAMPSASPRNAVVNQDVGQEPQVALNHPSSSSDTGLDHVPETPAVDEFENILLPSFGFEDSLLPPFGFENTDWNHVPTNEATMRPRSPNNEAKDQDAGPHQQGASDLLNDSFDSDTEEILAQVMRNEPGHVDWDAEFPDMS